MGQALVHVGVAASFAVGDRRHRRGCLGFRDRSRKRRRGALFGKGAGASDWQEVHKAIVGVYLGT
jgi:hypothetical protein